MRKLKGSCSLRTTNSRPVPLRICRQKDVWTSYLHGTPGRSLRCSGRCAASPWSPASWASCGSSWRPSRRRASWSAILRGRSGPRRPPRPGSGLRVRWAAAWLLPWSVCLPSDPAHLPPAAVKPHLPQTPYMGVPRQALRWSHTWGSCNTFPAVCWETTAGIFPAGWSAIPSWGPSAKPDLDQVMMWGGWSMLRHVRRIRTRSMKTSDETVTLSVQLLLQVRMRRTLVKSQRPGVTQKLSHSKHSGYQRRDWTVRTRQHHQTIRAEPREPQQTSPLQIVLEKHPPMCFSAIKIKLCLFCW